MNEDEVIEQEREGDGEKEREREGEERRAREIAGSAESHGSPTAIQHPPIYSSINHSYIILI